MYTVSLQIKDKPYDGHPGICFNKSVMFEEDVIMLLDLFLKDKTLTYYISVIDSTGTEFLYTKFPGKHKYKLKVYYDRQY